MIQTLTKAALAVALGLSLGGVYAQSPHGAAGAAAPAPNMGAMHSGMAKAPEVTDVKVAKATGADARTVAEVVGKRGELKNKTVVVNAKVVKFTPGVMGKNWVHIRDGSGSAADGTNDVTVTTKDETAVGEVVLVKGVVHTDVDLGSGYAYKVLIEEASLKPQKK